MGENSHKRSEVQIGNAIDIMCYDPATNKGTWELKYYKEVADLFKQKARELEIPITWGGDWKGFVDGVHFEIKS